MTPDAVRVVFMGSPAFAVPALEALSAAEYAVVAVVTQPDRPAGRGNAVHMPDVKVAALRHGIRVLQPASLKDEAFLENLTEIEADLFVVAAYGKILPRAVLSLPRFGVINVHASLLPRWRGASPIAAAILAGDESTGVSIMEMVLKMDAGPVISAASAPILASDTTGSLEERLSMLGASSLVEALPRWLGGDVRALPQDEGHVTYCRTLVKDDGHLRQDMTAADAERAVRAYNPWPGAYILYGSERLAVWGATVAAPAQSGGPAVGTLRTWEKQPQVAFSDGTWLTLDQVQRPGGKRISGAQFVNGERGKLESKVGLA